MTVYHGGSTDFPGLIIADAKSDYPELPGGWGDKGQEYRPDKCQHGPGDGCEWCCRTCNFDRHLCPGCGTVVDHKERACEDCAKL